jgi:hypothetical protein
MRLFVYVLVAAVVMTSLVCWCHRHDIEKMRDDYQAYSTRSLLPDGGDEEGTLKDDRLQ